MLTLSDIDRMSTYTLYLVQLNQNMCNLYFSACAYSTQHPGENWPQLTQLALRYLISELAEQLNQNQQLIKDLFPNNEFRPLREYLKELRNRLRHFKDPDTLKFEPLLKNLLESEDYINFFLDFIRKKDEKLRKLEGDINLPEPDCHRHPPMYRSHLIGEIQMARLNDFKPLPLNKVMFEMAGYFHKIEYILLSTPKGQNGLLFSHQDLLPSVRNAYAIRECLVNIRRLWNNLTMDNKLNLENIVNKKYKNQGSMLLRLNHIKGIGDYLAHLPFQAIIRNIEIEDRWLDNFLRLFFFDSEKRFIPISHILSNSIQSSSLKPQQIGISTLSTSSLDTSKETRPDEKPIPYFIQDPLFKNLAPTIQNEIANSSNETRLPNPSPSPSPQANTEQKKSPPRRWVSNDARSIQPISLGDFFFMTNKPTQKKKGKTNSPPVSPESERLPDTGMANLSNSLQ